ncbi:hypothetical protein [Blastococcus brunescens]|uniref:Acetyltransferase n=1 Tax=Blastococcus brunescens TaxID=1564165 RepID=A0ABZ1AX02_9ACTN|nr:hypothetical protein [Blastococcus sp. BMG 8361]WRL62466.1 hypothetical protein U6N30_20955 [Blastococcus sp. BMG 8361]
MTAELRLVGIEELAAGTLRDRLLADRTHFWSGSGLDDEAVRALHDPLFFHQLGGSAPWHGRRTARTPPTCWAW